VRTALVIGGGVAGLWAARALAARGVETTVLEGNRVGSGASAGNAGWVCPLQAGPVPAPGLVGFGLRSLATPDSPLYVAPRAIPALAPWLAAFARRCNHRDHAAGRAGPRGPGLSVLRLLEELAAARPGLRIDRDGLLVVAEHREPSTTSWPRSRPLAALGHPVPAGPADLAALREREPALAGRGARRGPRRGPLAGGPGAALPGAGGVAAGHGGPDRGGRRGARAASQRPRDRRGAHVVGRPPADVVVLATGAAAPALAAPAGVRLPVIGGKGYSFDVVPERMPRHSILFADAHVGAARIGDRVRVAGTMELGGRGLALDPRRLRTLERAARPLLGPWEVVGQPWTGLRPLAPDGLPIIGRAPGLSNLAVATGYSMLGMTISPAAGDLLAEELLTGERPAALEPFRPGRSWWR
jgi:D-amino-acid dehydrogenase